MSENGRQRGSGSARPPDTVGDGWQKTQFSLPAVGASPGEETGVILLGLDAPRLLAGLALAPTISDPALVALTVDEARHGVAGHQPFDELVEAGASRWRAARAGLLAAVPPAMTSASPRQAWNRTLRGVTTRFASGHGHAVRVYLAACLLRRDDVDRHTGAV